MAERECGDCGQCCKLLGVRELEKAPHVWRRYYKRGKGCEVYDSRPQGCAQFACDWLLDVRLDPRGGEISLGPVRPEIDFPAMAGGVVPGRAATGRPRPDPDRHGA